tara:strand:- start:190 stop:864 length:675 start_codon:yes stop_codon:yes gene_type:complete
MNWEDEGYLVSKNKFRENAIIIDIFTKNFGKVSGIVYGGTSRKQKNFLQLSNKLHIIYNSKAENKLGYFKAELIEAISPKYFNSQIKTICLNSLSSLIKILLPENETQKKIYNSLDNFFLNFDNNNWINSYLNWEMNLIRDLGYGLPIETSKFDKLNKNIAKVKFDNKIYEIPVFIIKNEYDNIDNENIQKGLIFSRTLMENKFFIPNNLRFPYSRKLLEKKIF